MTGAPSNSESPSVERALQRLKESVDSENVTAEIHDDGSAMTPMLVVDFGRGGDRADVLRELFHADGPVSVDSVHSHRVVVRGD